MEGRMALAKKEKSGVVAAREETTTVSEPKSVNEYTFPEPKNDLADEIVIKKPSIIGSAASEGKLSPELRKFRDEETVLVKGRFKNYESPGCGTKIVVKKYPGIPIFNKWLEDGQLCEVPLYVARHLNGVDVTAKQLGGKTHSCSYATHGFLTNQGGAVACDLNEQGIPIPKVGVAKRTRRYGFESLQFDVVA